MRGNLINLGTMSTSGVLNNTGTLTNSAILNTVITLNGGALTNDGTFSAVSLTNSGTFNNLGIAIIGDFSNTGASIEDPSTSQFQNVNIGAGGENGGSSVVAESAWRQGPNQEQPQRLSIPQAGSHWFRNPSSPTSATD